MPLDSGSRSAQRRSADVVKIEESLLGFGENGGTSWIVRVKRVCLPAPVFSAKIVVHRMRNLVIGMSWLDEYGIFVAFPALRQVAVLACPESSSRVFVLACCLV